MKRKFIYLSSKSYDGTVFITQVADWLNTYHINGVTFDYFHLFYYPMLWKRQLRKNELNGINVSSDFLKYYSYCFPSRGLFVFVNALLWYLKLAKDFKKFDEILIFSRNILGKEIKLLKKISPIPIIFFYDARAASAEENKYAAIKHNNFSYKKFKTIAHISYTEYITVNLADKIFTVSNKLKDYFYSNYNISNEKVQIYPCLSNSNKFYYDKQLRKNIRSELKIYEENILFLYAGGIANEYHVSSKTFEFFNYIASKNSNARFILLSKDKDVIENFLKSYDELDNKVIYMSVKNSEMVNYLNAADFGLLFRENVIMNNVASPTKFAEYMLCGLPTIISEGVGDYSAFCNSEKVGIVVSEFEMKNWELFNYQKISDNKFDRDRIAEIGKLSFTKESIVKDIIRDFKN